MSRGLKLLIIDDQLDTVPVRRQPRRRELYGRISDRFELQFLERLHDLPGLLAAGGIDAILMDFVLEKWDTNALALIPTIPAEIPIALISQHWTPNFDGLRQAMTSHQIATVFTWEDLSQDNKRELMEFWLDLVIRRRLGYSDRRPNDGKFIVLQLSDLQFGSEGPADVEIEMNYAAQAVRREFGRSPDVCCITGDITEGGLPEEFREAQEWFTTFLSKLDPTWDPSRTLVIPGNHDVCWPLALSYRVDPVGLCLRDSASDSHGLKGFAFEPYLSFERSMAVAPQRLEGSPYWVSAKYISDGVVFFGYNTSEELDRDGRATAELSDKGLARLCDELQSLKTRHPDALVAGLFHHPLYGGSHTAERVLNLFQRLGTVILLTGHVHSEGGYLFDSTHASILQIVAGTMTKREDRRPRDTLRGFNVIEFSYIAGCVSEILVKPFQFERTRVRVGEASRFRRSGSGVISRVSEETLS